MRLRMDSPLLCRTYEPQVVAVALWATHSMNVMRTALRTAKRLQVLSNTAPACNCRRQDCLRHMIAREVQGLAHRLSVLVRQPRRLGYNSVACRRSVIFCRKRSTSSGLFSQ